ncbi:MAG: T9SS type A sorting domain-containing protein, partial [Bacteroidales bacterium]|nr:T9SS type A sorting domain-containing protein [Bacteroidales bacterium]
LLAYKTLLSGPGYGPGNDFTIKFWDESEGMEVTDFTYEFIDPYGQGLYMGDVFPLEDNVFTLANLNFTSVVPYVPSFNIYQDDMLIAEGVDGTTFMVDGLDNGTEYCFYVTQNMEDLSESDASNVLCATPFSECEDVVINLWPVAPADVCFGTPVDIDFSGVEILNAASYLYSVDPDEAGSFDGDFFLLDDMYVGVVTITLNAYATPPCMDASASLSFEVYPLPVFDCPAYGPFCEGDENIMFMEDGDFFYGGNLIDGWNPSVVGTFTITYVYTDPDTGCSDECMFDIVVNPAPVAECPEYAPICVGFGFEFPIVENWVYTNSVGETVIGIDADVPGNFEFTLTVTNEFDCSASCPFEILVNPAPVVECPDDIVVCVLEDFELTGATPEGGTYSGDGVENGWFFTIVAGLGDHTITYTYMDDVTGCENFCTFIVTVNDLPAPVCPPGFEVCVNGDPVDLEGASPEGGTYGGVGVYEGVFYPDSAGVGYHELYYSYTDPETLCTGFCVIGVDVYPLPEVTCPEDMVYLLDELPVTLEGAEPIGGTYSGEGVEEGVFFVEEEGFYEITYTYTDIETGCTNSCMFIITVNDEPPVCEDAVINFFPEFQEDVCAGTELVIDFSGVEILNAINVMWSVDPEDAGEYDGTDFVLNTDYVGEVTLALFAEAQAPCANAEASLTFMVNPLPYIEVELSATEVCLGESVTATVNGPADGAYPYLVSYTINDMPFEIEMPEAFGELELLEMTPGTYEGVLVSIVDNKGCMAMPNEVFTVVVYSLPTIEVELSATEVCLGESVTATVNGPVDGAYPYLVTYTIDGTPYEIEMLEAFGELELLEMTPGTYEGVLVSIVDNNGCMSMPNEVFTVVVNPLPEFDCPVYGPFCLGDEEEMFEETGDFYFDGAQIFGWTPDMADTFTITYVYTDLVTGCSDECTFDIVVNELPYLELSLSASEICLGETVNGSITGPEDGEYPYVVEYSINGVPMTDQILSPVTVLPLTPDMAGVYTLEVLSVVDNNGCIAMEVAGVELIVLPLTEITLQPVSLEVEFSMPAEFSVEADNATGYQWYHNDMMIADATDATYSIASAMPEDAGTYYCVVMGDCDDVTSEVVTLAVLPWTQTIDLLGAINGFSTYLDVIEDDVATIFNPIVANVQVVDFVSPFFTWVPNGLDYTLNEEKGALVQLSGGYPTSIDVMGYPTLGNSLDLPGGVTNYLPVWSQNVVLADDVFGPISDDIYAVFSQDYSGYWFPMYNLYTLEYLVPGSSYIVLLNNDATVSFDVPAVDAAPGYADIPGNVTTWNDVTLTASQHNIVITADAMSQLEVDDVIGAFNEYGQITGMVEINSLRDNTMLRTYGDNPFTQRNEGFVDGDIMTIKVWRNGEEMIADATFDANMPNDNVFAKNGISTITNLKLGITSINDLTSGLTASLYPNPATDVVNVSTNFEIKNLKVVNYVGQVVFDQNVEQMNFQINTSNYVSGMYFVQIETNDGAVITKRLTVK